MKGRLSRLFGNAKADRVDDGATRADNRAAPMSPLFAKREGYEIDRGRLSLFDLDASELPFETLITWGMSIWPAKMPLPGQPRDGYADSFFDEPNAYVMTGSDLADDEAVDGSIALFGIVARLQLSLLLVTNKRLLWLPIDKAQETYQPGSYPVYRTAAMGARWVNRADFDYAELVGMPTGDLPDGLVTSLAISFAFKDRVANPIQGPGWPRFDLHDVAEFERESLDQPCALFAVASIAEPMVDLFMLGLAEAGFAVLPPEMPEALRKSNRQWRPLHEKVTPVTEA